MDMDISSLLSALQSTQQKKSSVRLSERNVVELIIKLKQLGLFGDELLHTINGKEYITTDRLKVDIQTALRQAGGRLELTELPALVGVDLAHCEKQVGISCNHLWQQQHKQQQSSSAAWCLVAAEHNDRSMVRTSAGLPGQTAIATTGNALLPAG
jgi:hypothetical protein